jgi:hypothetical protein
MIQRECTHSAKDGMKCKECGAQENCKSSMAVPRWLSAMNKSQQLFGDYVSVWERHNQGTKYQDRVEAMIERRRQKATRTA